MQFTIGEVHLEAEVEAGETFTSKHTGRELSRLKLEFSCQGKRYNDQVLDLFKQAQKEGLASLAADVSTIRWKATTNSWHYTDHGPRTIYHHTWNIEEQEILNIEKLIMDGLEVEPYKYEEEFDGETLIITARIRQSQEEREGFADHFEEKEYFPVVRRGITEEAKEMRFGVGVWSKEGDVLKRQIILVDRVFDDRHKSRRLFQPQMSNMQIILATVNSTVNELLDLLSNKGVLSKQDVELLKQASEERAYLTHRDFYEVDDIDEWLDSEEE